MTKAKLAMTDLRTKLFPLFRRSSTSSAASSITSTDVDPPTLHKTRSRSKISLRPKSKPVTITDIQEEAASGSADTSSPAEAPATTSTVGSASVEELDHLQPAKPLPEPQNATAPAIALEDATPDSQASLRASITQSNPAQSLAETTTKEGGAGVSEQVLRKQSLALHADHHLIRSLLQTHDPRNGNTAPGIEEEHPAASTSASDSATVEKRMVYRKIWVKRPGASATLVQINEDYLVDDVRDMILKKYANSLGRSFDSPDVTLRIIAREHSHRHGQSERVLGPEEHMTKTLDAFYPGGQTVDEALIIDVPYRRTPRHSPRVPMPSYHASEDMRPTENDQGYFPVIPPGVIPSPHLASNISATGSTGSDRHHHSISVLNTGVVPPLPSPSGRTTRPGHRPRFGRNNTSSPTANATSHNDNRLHTNPPNAPPLPTPPLPAPAPARTATPPPRPASPRPKPKRISKRNSSTAPAPLPGALLDGTVPPISVLIVEDNVINLKLLEAFMKRLKVRYHSAMNGRDAVSKWRNGGFHLVLMDIQLPLMNGLDATKEIRRLESVNGVGLLGAKVSSVNGKRTEDTTISDKDKLKNLELFKSSVIIVALTASNLQSDRHEALAAGCNDFLTKPVNFVWLERKVTEWGCMQALIDFDGWRKWKDLPAATKPGGMDTKAGKSTTTVSTPLKRQALPSSRTSEATNSSSSEAQPLGNADGADTVEKPQSHSETDKPTLKVQAPTPPPVGPVKLAGGGGGGTDGAGGKTTPASTGSKEARRAKRSSLGLGSGLTGVAEEREHEEGREVGVGA